MTFTEAEVQAGLAELERRSMEHLAAHGSFAPEFMPGAAGLLEKQRLEARSIFGGHYPQHRHSNYDNEYPGRRDGTKNAERAA